jgi:hypothetical protein
MGVKKTDEKMWVWFNCCRTGLHLLVPEELGLRLSDSTQGRSWANVGISRMAVLVLRRVLYNYSLKWTASFRVHMYRGHNLWLNLKVKVLWRVVYMYRSSSETFVNTVVMLVWNCLGPIDHSRSVGTAYWLLCFIAAGKNNGERQRYESFG